MWKYVFRHQRARSPKRQILFPIVILSLLGSFGKIWVVIPRQQWLLQFPQLTSTMMKLWALWGEKLFLERKLVFCMPWWKFSLAKANFSVIFSKDMRIVPNKLYAKLSSMRMPMLNLFVSSRRKFRSCVNYFVLKELRCKKVGEKFLKFFYLLRNVVPFFLVVV